MFPLSGSENHRMVIEWLRLEGTLETIYSNLPASQLDSAAQICSETLNYENESPCSN